MEELHRGVGDSVWSVTAKEESLAAAASNSLNDKGKQKEEKDPLKHRPEGGQTGSLGVCYGDTEK